MSIRTYFYQTVSITLLAGLTLTLVVAVASATIKWYFIPQLPSTETLKDINLQVPLRVYTKSGELIAEFGEQRRIPIALHQVPPLFIKAVQAAEDDRFFDHPGVDPKSLVRAVVSLVKTGEKQQGGSTITMQVARNFFLSPERSYARKFNEILLALKIENEFSKQEILELYLNKIFFGHRAYGIAAAAQVYYGKSVQELTIAEMAMLAGLPKAPSANNPLANPERAIERRNYILGRMYELGYINHQQYAEAVQSPSSAQQHVLEIKSEAPYMAEMARSYMIKTFGEEAAYTRGFKVYTTVDFQGQKVAQKALRNALYTYDERHGYRGPVARVKMPKNFDLTKANEILENYSVHANLIPSLVLETRGKTVVAYNPQGGEFVMEWKDLSWAYRYRNDNRVGSAPSWAGDIVRRGDIIMARRVREESKEPPKEPKVSKVKAPKKGQKGQTVEVNNSTTPSPAPPAKIRWRLAEVPQVEGALVAINPNDGAIIALVGGFDFYHSKFNRVIQADRQPGSNFKPFIYSSALARGFTPASIINDAPIMFKVGNKVWRPANYSHKYYGPTSLRHALAFSRNVASVRLLSKVGVKKAIDHVVKFGFKREKIPQNLTIALGTADVTPLELVTGYAVFANGGHRVEPYFIDHIEDATGKIVFTANPLQVCSNCPAEILSAAEISSANQEAENQPLLKTGMECTPPPRYAPRAITPQNAYMMTSILQDVIRIGTGQKARELKRNDIAGKTGTTNDQRDAWFSGFNRDIAATAWVGFDHPRSLGYKETGGKAALPMWIDFMRGALKDSPQKPFVEPKGVVAVRVDPLSGLRSRDNDGVFEPFAEDTVPKALPKRPRTERFPFNQKKPTSTPTRSHRYSGGRQEGNNNRSSGGAGNSSRGSSGGSNGAPSAPKKSSVQPDQLF